MKTIEKKQYVNPSMEVVMIQRQQLLAGSDPALNRSDAWESSDGDPI